MKESIDCSLAFTSTVTCSGAPADDGETSANSSLSLRGFSTIPTTVRRRPSSARVAPRLEPQEVGDAVGDRDLAGTDGVAAAAQREQRATVGPSGLCARKSTFSTPPGTGIARWPMTSIVPNDRRAAASPASSLRGSEPSNLSSSLAEPNSRVNDRSSRCGRS